MIIAILAVETLLAADDTGLQDPFRFITFWTSASWHLRDNLSIYRKRLCN
jgi:hypothetical protein